MPTQCKEPKLDVVFVLNNDTTMVLLCCVIFLLITETSISSLCIVSCSILFTNN